MAPNPSSDISPTLASGKGVDKKKIRKLSSKSENTVSVCACVGGDEGGRVNGWSRGGLNNFHCTKI